MASVTFDRVSKRYGEVTAVAELSLEIADQEFMVLLGPSGCGKTTALRMIAGLEDISDGTLRIGDQVVNDVEPGRRDISMVFQSYALYPHLTVARNIESPLIVREYAADGAHQPLRRLTRDERNVRVAEAARTLGLEPYLKRKPAALSGGQRQRVALARAIVARPKAFLMDEPLSNLDAKLRAQTRAELVDLHRRVETTVVYVTHDQVEAMTMATRIAIMNGGRLQQVGTPQDVYAAPTNLFVAQFIGTPPMNTIEGVVTTATGSPAIDVGGSRFPMPPGLTTHLDDAQPVVVGVRPEHLRLAPGPIEAKIVHVEWLGHECLITCSIGGKPAIVRQVGMSSVEPGSTVALDVDPSAVHVFDAETTGRME